MAEEAMNPARRRMQRQVGGMFAGSALLTVGSVAAYFGLDAGDDGGGVKVGELQISNLVLGMTLGVALLLAGVGAIRWAGTGDDVRDDVGADDQQTPGTASQGTTAKLSRRGLVRAAIAGGLALLPAIILLRAVAPATSKARRRTVWAPGVRLLTDVSRRPVRPSDLEVGELVNVMPASLDDVPPSDAERTNARAKSAVVLVRMGSGDIVPAAGRERWQVDGIVAYSKICTHVGCPMGLYERTTKHLLCPCHQSTFDLADSGAVLFGPATRSLPQLPLAVDTDGYLVARSDFTEPVGPSYWER